MLDGEIKCKTKYLTIETCFHHHQQHIIITYKKEEIFLPHKLHNTQWTS